MYLLNFGGKNMNKKKLVCEDLSPILKENQADNGAGKFNLFNKFGNQAEEDSDETKNLVSQFDTVSIESEDTDDYQTACSDIEVQNKKVTIRKKENDCKSRKNTCNRPLQKENCSPERIKKPGKPKVKKTKEVSKKKKDSFIVSDDSTISNDSMTIYHKVLSKDIRTDVRKMTPRTRLKKSITTNDDGIFTPYVFGKRSTSESSLTDEEVENDNISKNYKFPKNQLFLDSDETNGNAIVSSKSTKNSPFRKIDDFKDDSSNLFRTSQPKPKSRVSSGSPLPVKNIFKDLSWIFTDDESFFDLKSMDDKNVETRSNIDVEGGDKLVTPSRKKSPSMEKPGKSKARASLTTTPITFRLKQVKNLTPKNDEHENAKPLSFLRSLSTFNSPRNLHPDAENYKKKFKKSKKSKEELTVKLFKMFNEEVFRNQLPSDLKIEWNARLRSSSGLCYNRRIKTIKGPNNECLRSSRIALSTKIIETPDRLRDTLIHEMCHAAAWIIDNKCEGHGPSWKAWAKKAMKTFPELPTIRRCHDYSVKTKFNYRCEKCGYTIGRHSKSLNLERKRCGYCYGKFELVSKCDVSRTNASPKNVKARPLSKFALFVKENYGKIRSEKPDLKHGEIMKELSKNFASTKISSI